MVGQSAHELWREFNSVNSWKAQLILAKEIVFVHSANAAPKRAQDHEVWHQADKPLSDAFNRCSLILYLVTIHSQFIRIYLYMHLAEKIRQEKRLRLQF